jgi:hypothetical protein
MKPQLSGSHRRTYDSLFRHPPARNLAWRDVRSMLGALAEARDFYAKIASRKTTHSPTARTGSNR